MPPRLQLMLVYLRTEGCPIEGGLRKGTPFGTSASATRAAASGLCGCACCCVGGDRSGGIFWRSASLCCSLPLSFSLSTRATLAVTRSIGARSMPPPEQTSPVRVEQISDCHDEGGFAQAGSIRAYLDGLRAAGSRTLAELIRDEIARGRPVRCVVYDSFLPWVLDVAKGAGLRAAAFFSQSCAVNAVYYHVYRGQLTVPHPGPTLWPPAEGLPELGLADAPSFIAGPSGPYPAYLAMEVNQFSNLERADAILVNTFYQLEPQVRARVDVVVVGKLSVNLTGFTTESAFTFGNELIQSITDLLPFSQAMPLSVEYLNTTKLQPRKDNNTGS